MRAASGISGAEDTGPSCRWPTGQYAQARQDRPRRQAQVRRRPAHRHRPAPERRIVLVNLHPRCDRHPRPPRVAGVKSDAGYVAGQMERRSGGGEAGQGTCLAAFAVGCPAAPSKWANLLRRPRRASGPRRRPVPSPAPCLLHLPRSWIAAVRTCCTATQPWSNFHIDRHWEAIPGARMLLLQCAKVYAP